MLQQLVPLDSLMSHLSIAHDSRQQQLHLHRCDEQLQLFSDQSEMFWPVT
jgi:hypothetical protein